MDSSKEWKLELREQASWQPGETENKGLFYLATVYIDPRKDS